MQRYIIEMHNIYPYVIPLEKCLRLYTKTQKYQVKINNKYHVTSYKTLPWIIPAFLTTLCSENVVFSNKTRIRRLCEIILLMCRIWGNTVDLVFSHWYLFFGQSNGKALVVNSSSNIFLNLLVPKNQFHIH